MKSLKITIIFLSLVVLALFVVHYLLFGSIRIKNEHISTLENQLSMENDKESYLVSAKKTLDDLSSDTDRISNSIIANGEDVKFIESLESLASSEGLTMDIQSLSFESDPKLASTTVTIFKIKGKTEGSWAGNYTFLAQVESLPFKVKVNRFSLENTAEKASGPTASGPWQAEFEIRVLKYK